MTRWPYDTYVFDLYGTLADIRTDEDGLWPAFSWELRLRGMDWVPDALRREYLRLCGENLKEKEAALRSRGLPGPAEADIREVFRALGGMAGKALTAEETDAVARTFRALSLRKLRLFEGARETLAELRRGKRRLILLTNAQAAFTGPELRYLGIESLFDRILISSDYGMRKPSPAFFSLALDAGSSPERTVMVGNDHQCDCAGAAALGMDSFYLRTEQSPPLDGPLPRGCRALPCLPALLPPLP